MKEGWHNDDYLILFEGSEIEEKEKDYQIDRLLPGHRLVGMVGFDEPLFADPGMPDARLFLFCL
jgi:hypothetical protein